jgi:hypothetical protein
MSWDRGEGQGRHRRRPLLVAGVILLAVVLLGLVARQVPTGDSLAVDDPTPIPSRPSPNITVRTEDEQEPESPSPSPSPLGVPQTRQIDPPLPGVSGLFLWVASPNGELARVELGTGASIVADVLEERADQISLVPDGAGGVALTAFSFSRAGESRPDLHALHVAGPGAPPVDLGAAAQAFPSATAGRVWLLDASVLIAPDVAPSHVREVAADGTVITTLTLRPGMRVVAVVQGGLLVTAAGDYFVHDPSRGRGPRLDQGQVLAADTRVVVRHVCDETLACWLSVGAIDDPEPRRLEIDQALEGSLGMGLFYAPPVLSSRSATAASWASSPRSRTCAPACSGASRTTRSGGSSAHPSPGARTGVGCSGSPAGT